MSPSFSIIEASADLVDGIQDTIICNVVVDDQPLAWMAMLLEGKMLKPWHWHDH